MYNINKMVDLAFKTDQNGRKVYFPFGFWGKGRVIPDEATEKKLRTKLRIRALILCFLPLLIIATLQLARAHNWKFTWETWLALILVPIPFGIWEYFITKKYVSGWEISELKLGIKETYARQGTIFHKWFVWLSIIILVPAYIFFAGSIFLLKSWLAVYVVALTGIVLVFYLWILIGKKN